MLGPVGPLTFDAAVRDGLASSAPFQVVRLLAAFAAASGGNRRTR